MDEDLDAAFREVLGSKGAVKSPKEFVGDIRESLKTLDEALAKAEEKKKGWTYFHQRAGISQLKEFISTLESQL